MNAMTEWSTDNATETTAASLLLGNIVAEVEGSATTAQRRTFFRAVGARIAAGHPVGDAQDIAALAASINRLWREHDCGEVRFELAEDGLLITHTGFLRRLAPVIGDATEHTLRPLLEGAYDAWLHTLGSSTNLTTRTLWWTDTEVRLKHGR
ncbi:MAG: hypothetical protein EOP89_01130 [Lysobacteraceae bacterium]|jgi:hypothetical protein|nr:MAG: hypothetical protein EOP89_01130 [Xanthomonadaceae bacterium]